MNSDSMFDMSSNMDNTELHTSSVDVGQPATTRSLSVFWRQSLSDMELKTWLHGHDW